MIQLITLITQHILTFINIINMKIIMAILLGMILITCLCNNKQDIIKSEITVQKNISEKGYDYFAELSKLRLKKLIYCKCLQKSLDIESQQQFDEMFGGVTFYKTRTEADYGILNVGPFMRNAVDEYIERTKGKYSLPRKKDGKLIEDHLAKCLDLYHSIQLNSDIDSFHKKYFNKTMLDFLSWKNEYQEKLRLLDSIPLKMSYIPKGVYYSDNWW